MSGHIDAVGHVEAIAAEGDSTRLAIAAPDALTPFIAAKGSITVDGVSLTVNNVEDQADGSVLFGLNIIPHTAEVTTLGALTQGASVNLEIDTVARYLQRLERLKGEVSARLCAVRLRLEAAPARNIACRPVPLAQILPVPLWCGLSLS